MKVKINGSLITTIAMWGSLYVNYWFGFFSIFIPNITLVGLVFIIDIISVIAIVINLMKQRIKFAISQVFTILVAVLIVFLYYTTQFMYGYQNKSYETYGLVLVSQTIMSIVLACFIAHNCLIQYQIKKFVPYVSLVFSFTAVYNTLFAEGMMGGGWINNDNGMNYQAISYLAAFSTVFAEYYILEVDNVKWSSFFKKKIGNIVCVSIAIINVFTIFIAGGRGGLVLSILSIMYTIYVLIKREGSNKVGIFRNSMIVFSVPVVFIGVISVAKKSSIKFSGIQRLLDLQFFFSDKARDKIRNNAFSIISNKPLFGYGLGSDFYEMGLWTHNLFIDLLLESGAVGLIIFCSIMAYGLYLSFKLVQRDSTNRIWWMIFATGFIMSMFSGYYLTNTMIALCVSFWGNSHKNKI
ncbi:MAG: O-antigen ligase family protein [Lachnospiraceae bacterium]|nr:O-antigen ligase family protein [Lachnospiraceae bacterium]